MKQGRGERRRGNKGWETEKVIIKIKGSGREGGGVDQKENGRRRMRGEYQSEAGEIMLGRKWNKQVE